MHSDVFARHVTAAAIELCISLEKVLMKETYIPQKQVKDFMDKSPVVLEPWQPVAYVRQLILTHSFSYLPVYLQSWKLVRNIGLLDTCAPTMIGRKRCREQLRKQR